MTNLIVINKERVLISYQSPIFYFSCPSQYKVYAGAN